MARENFKITDKDSGKEFRISRSVAVVACLVTIDPVSREYNFLVERRGKGCPDFSGALSFPCGYLGWDEDTKDAVIREVYEELGITLNKDLVCFWKIVDDPARDARQNVVVRFVCPLKHEQVKMWLDNGVNLDSKSRGGEKDEVEEVLLVPFSEVESGKDSWAFGHQEVISELASVLNEYFDESDIDEASVIEEAAEDTGTNPV